MSTKTLSNGKVITMYKVVKDKNSLPAFAWAPSSLVMDERYRTNESNNWIRDDILYLETNKGDDTILLGLDCYASNDGSSTIPPIGNIAVVLKKWNGTDWDIAGSKIIDITGYGVFILEETVPFSSGTYRLSTSTGEEYYIDFDLSSQGEITNIISNMVVGITVTNS